MRGRLDVYCDRFKVGGIIGGDNDGTSVAAFFETEIKAFCYAGDGYASFTTPPQYGMLLYPNATDNIVEWLIASFMTEYAIDSQGGQNHIKYVHGFGDVLTGRPLKRCLIVEASTTADHVYADTCSLAGISVQTDRAINVSKLQSYHPSGQQPATGTYAPLVIEAVNGSIDPSLCQITIGDINVRGALSSDPAIKNNNASTPRDLQYAAISGMAKPSFVSNLGYGNVKNTFSISGISGVSSFLNIEVSDTNKNAFQQFWVAGKIRHIVGKENTTEAGSNTGSDYVGRSYADDGTTLLREWLRYYRSSDTLALSGRVQVGLSADRVAFYGGTPIVKQTGTAANATDLATAITLVNDLKAKLIALNAIA